ncbi:autotransporter-associated beta strand repeat-containing protein, partial [Staphylococcus aureus]|uniref:autotransporter-associated beta strand repeat-containing protein n=1 Tax=Staphylococcus aureus TaxID=1280 RepID=UPI00123EA3B7
TIPMIDPTATFGATGTYANNISLEVAAPSSANPSTLNTDAGVIATLTGAITTGTGAGVDPNQDLVFGGTGTVILTNAGNSWTGTTTINHGATLQGSAAAISGSAIVNNGELVYDEAGNSIGVANIPGSGNFHKIGSGSLTLTGGNSWTGTTTINHGATLQGSAAAISGSAIV